MTIKAIATVLLAFVASSLCQPHCFDYQDRRRQDLLSAVKKKDYVKLHELLKNGVSPNISNSDGLTPMALAVSTSDIRALQILCRHGGNLAAPVTKVGHSLVYWACLKEASDRVLRFIFEKWPSKASKVPDLNPSLLKAAFIGRQGMVNILLSNGAVSNCEDRRGVTPLQITTSVEVARTLLKHGAEINHTSVDGQTALHAAAYDGNYRLVALLISLGAHINKTDLDGDNELHSLVEGYRSSGSSRYVKVCHLLLKNGASELAKNKAGLTPERLAISQGKRKLALELRQHE